MPRGGESDNRGRGGRGKVGGRGGIGMEMGGGLGGVGQAAVAGGAAVSLPHPPRQAGASSSQEVPGAMAFGIDP